MTKDGMLIYDENCDYLEVEYLPLPIIDLSFRCMVRFKKPIPTIFFKEPLIISVKLNEVRYTEGGEDILSQAIKEKCLILWKSRVMENVNQFNEEEIKCANYLINQPKFVKLIELKVVPVEVNNG